MVNCGVFVRLEAKEGKEADVQDLLTGALDLPSDFPFANSSTQSQWFAAT